MARALGGSVARSPKAELGWHEIESDDKALIPTGPWFEYHWDRWTLPKGVSRGVVDQRWGFLFIQSV
jgi:GMP synthase-like glutamine amidotransferase